jgi:guanylate kinase
MDGWSFYFCLKEEFQNSTARGKMVEFQGWTNVVKKYNSS